MFSPGAGGIDPGNKTILKKIGPIPNLCDKILCPKSPGRAFQFRQKFIEIFLLKHLRPGPVPKSCVSNTRGQWLFWPFNLQGIPAIPTLRENTDRCINAIVSTWSENLVKEDFYLINEFLWVFLRQKQSIIK